MTFFCALMYKCFSYIIYLKKNIVSNFFFCNVLNNVKLKKICSPMHNSILTDNLINGLGSVSLKYKIV